MEHVIGIEDFKIEKGSPLPLGVTIQEDGINFAFEVQKEEPVRLLLYKKGSSQAEYEIPFPAENRMGQVVFMKVRKLDTTEMEYNYACGDEVLPDLYARRIIGREMWGAIPKHGLRCGFNTGEFSWEGDKAPQIPYKDTILYRMHVRGFTRHSSSKVRAKGTYEGIMEKIPYLKDLGVTMVELLPVHEFEEIRGIPVYGKENMEWQQTDGINYWGYTKGFYFTPKASYAYGRDACREFKCLVRELHKNRIELCVEFYFVPGTRRDFILDCLRYWVMEYHVDGIHINADVAPMEAIAQDPLLAGIKIMGNHWNISEIYGQKAHERNLAEYHDGFLVDIRRFLKGDEDQVNSFIARLTRNPKDMAVVNYLANHDSLTLSDLVSYEQKHNEANGENNRDGNMLNYSWNCGEEGETRRKKVLERRGQQIRNALLMLFLSQGTPMLLAGDELGRTKNGNNNAYCQDNEVSWINWRLTKQKEEIFRFVKGLIAFRKAHPIFRMTEELKGMDYGQAGWPDISYHGAKAWYPELDHYSRCIGIMYCGAYVKKENGEEDDFFYVAYNAHWEEKSLALPNLPKGKRWYLKIHTGSAMAPFLMQKEIPLENQKEFRITGRTSVVLIGKQP